jgi:hypothetical protein
VSNIKSWTAFRRDGTLAGHFRIKLGEVIGKPFCLEVYDGVGYEYVGSYKTLSGATQRAKKYRAAKGDDK